MGGKGDGGGFVGRESEVAELRSALASTREAGRGGFIAVDGEAGIGKTTLLDVICASAAEIGVVAVRGAGSVLDRSRPFGPLVDALGLLDRQYARDLPGAVAAEHRWLTGMLTGRGEAGRRSPLQTVAEERGRIIEGIAATLEAWSNDSPVALIVDDLQWADTATLAALGRLLRLTATQPLLVVAAYRPLPQVDELAALTTEGRRAGGRALSLGPLAPSAVTNLIGRMAGAPPGPRLGSLAAMAGGNPFLIVELVRGLADGGHLRTGGGIVEVAESTDPVVARQVHDAILRRMADLGPSATTMLQIAAALGPRFSVNELSAALGHPVPALLPDIALAVKAGLLVDDDKELRFRHDLVREAIETSVTPSALAALHLHIARTIAATGAPAVRVATHYALGAQPGDRSAVSWLRAAAREIVTQAPSAAADLLDRALALTDVSDIERDLLIAELVDAAFWSGQVERAAELGNRALARPLAPSVAADLHETMARVQVLLGRPNEAVSHAQAIEAQPGQLAWVGALIAIFQLFALDLEGALTGAESAVRLADANDDRWAATLGLCVLCWIDNVRGFHQRAAQSARRAVEVADGSASGEAHRLIPHLFHGLALESAGHSPEAEATLGRGQELADRLGTTWAIPFYHYALALPHWNAGRWDDVLAECEAGLRYANVHDVGLVSGWACAVSASAYIHRNELDRAQEMLAAGEARLAAGGVQYGIDWLVWASGLLAEAKGDPATALSLLALGWDAAYGLQAAATLVLVGSDLVRLAIDLGDDERARSATVALERSEPGDDRLNVDAHAMRCRGLLESDTDLLFEARRIHAECLRPVEVVLDEEALVLASLRGGRLDEAEQLVQQALDSSEKLGMRMVGDRIARSAAKLGFSRAPRRRQRQVTGWDALTDTEQRVARHVAAGRSNPQVAHELVISRRTVESHLYRIFFKLGVANRTELAVVVHRLGEGQRA